MLLQFTDRNVVVTLLASVLTTAGLGTVAAEERTVGLVSFTAEATDGYTLFAPGSSTTTYLVDLAGNVVHSWVADSRPGQSVYLLEDGHLLRTGSLGPGGTSVFSGGGAGGTVTAYDWHGTQIWSYEYSSTEVLAHHDVEWLPNGNVLMIAWEHRSSAEAIAAGRDPSRLRDGELWPDHIVEIEPGAAGSTIVWEWHVWDHLIQDFDPTKDNYGVIADHPELIDLNFTAVGGAADWNHTNAIDYNPDLDQILVSVRCFSEIWIIDHSTTTAEAAGHGGGARGRGGDLLYRWGNPQAYETGGPEDQQLFVQHDAQWIQDGHPGAGNILVFNNGEGRPEGDHSSVDEIVPPVMEDGTYLLVAGAAYGPDSTVWSYVADPAESFYASHISGTQRLSNGNTLSCSGPDGTFFEVTADGDEVWRYVNPVTSDGIVTQGDAVSASNSVFRAVRYEPTYPGLAGRDLSSGDPIEGYDQAPTAAFGWSQGAPETGQTIQFQDSSTGFPTTWSWDFGDGSTSAEQNPTHLYLVAGTYTVILDVSNPAGSDSASVIVEVTVSDGIFEDGFESGLVDAWSATVSEAATS